MIHDLDFTWPDIFDHPELIATREPAALLADGLCAWGYACAGSKPPASFGAVLVQVAKRLGMTKAPTGEALTEHAYAMGWLKRDDTNILPSS